MAPQNSKGWGDGIAKEQTRGLVVRKTMKEEMRRGIS